MKNLPANAGDTGSIPGSGKSPGGGNGKPTPVFLPGRPHGQRSLAGCSPWGHKELDRTEQRSTHTKHTHVKLSVLASCQRLVQGHGARSRRRQPPPSRVSGTSSPARSAPLRQRPSPLADPAPGSHRSPPGLSEHDCSASVIVCVLVTGLFLLAQRPQGPSTW